MLEKSAATTGMDPNPMKPITTEAMKWEAWAFSDRPDFSAVIHDAHLNASREKAFAQELFSDHRPDEQKALYYRATALAHCRYECLGESYAGNSPVAAAITVNDDSTQGVKNPWRRFLRKCSRVDKLTKPAVRFILPLTKSFGRAPGGSDDSTAALLIVLDDHWFAEAGLAEELEVRIPLVKNPLKPDESYLDWGGDPALTGRAQKPYADPQPIFTPAGPVGLTFDLAAQTPKLRGCAFILSLSDLPADFGIDPQLRTWFMMRVSVRRAVRKAFCETKPDEDIENALGSEWTQPEWVQFLPAMDYLIPESWRNAVTCDGYLALGMESNGLATQEDHWRGYDQSYRERMQQWLILTERVTDIGGQPCERYVATLVLNDGGSRFEVKDWASKKQQDLAQIKEGYARLILVRCRKVDKSEPIASIWNGLFGVSVDPSTVENDPLYAAPLVTDRIPFRCQNDCKLR